MVDIWITSLDQTDDQVRSFAAVLNDDECTRAARFVFDRDRRRYVVARGTLRKLLSQYSGIAADQISFMYGPAGKPALSDGNVRFNIAHSDELAIFAISEAHDVGIDVELLRPIEDAAAIVQRYFCEREKSVVLAASGEAHTLAFMRYWTRKESILKLTGDGLSLPLNLVDVSWSGNESPAGLHLSDASGRPWTFRVRDLQVAPSYAAAVAVQGHDDFDISFRGAATLV